MEFIKRFLGRGYKSRRIAEQQATIAQLRDKLHLCELRIEFLEQELSREQRELGIQKNATANMWKFIHTRHRLNVPAEEGSIRETLQRLDRQ